ncbi:MAG: hypothetical protein LUE20_05745 [Oscillospiraceae bacterium]|nr:hypothetical protein [Oscillospiraceae bacterium]
MRLSDDYKNELSRLTLSDDFKAKLKEQCIAVAGADKATDTETEEKAPEITETKSGKIYSQMKVYRYVAIAACVVAAISIVGGASIMSSVFSTTMRSSDSASTEDIMTESIEETDTMTEDDDDVIDVADEPVEATDDIIVADPATDVDDSEDAEYEEEEAADESNILTGSSTSSASSYTPDDYDGDYNTEDYVLGGSNTNASNTADVYSSFSALAADVGYVSYSTDSGNDEDILEGSDYDTDYEEALPVEDTYDGDTVESSDFDTPVKDYDEAASSSLPDITTNYGTASNFYDILYNQMGDESDTIGVSLVWITITGTPDASGVPSPSTGGYTLYSANISYDYLNAVSCDIDIYVWIKGTEDYQVEGMPTYEAGDELIVSLILGENGCITVIDELIYDAYTLNGVDIVYHRVYENVNPGSTDMGILDSEREYYTTTSNNPVIYVHKASARELTRYIRRKVSGEGYSLADLEKISQYSMGLVSYSTFTVSSSGDTEEEETDTSSEAKSTLTLNAASSTSYFELTAAGEDISMNDSSSAERLGELYQSSMTGTSSEDGTSTAMFVGGHLTFSSETPFTGGITEIEITSSGCPLDIQFRGISVGDSLATVKEKLSTSSTDVVSQNLTDDCVITVKSNYGTVKLTVEYGVLTKIVITA